MIGIGITVHLIILHPTRLESGPVLSCKPPPERDEWSDSCCGELVDPNDSIRADSVLGHLQGQLCPGKRRWEAESKAGSDEGQLAQCSRPILDRTAHLRRDVVFSTGTRGLAAEILLLFHIRLLARVILLSDFVGKSDFVTQNYSRAKLKEFADIQAPGFVP